MTDLSSSLQPALLETVIPIIIVITDMTVKKVLTPQSPLCTQPSLPEAADEMTKKTAAKVVKLSWIKRNLTIALMACVVRFWANTI